MEQQENQYDIVTDTERAEKRREKVKKQAFFGGLFWGFIIGGIFSCLCIWLIRGVLLYQHRNTIPVPAPETTDKDDDSDVTAQGTAITNELLQKLRALESAIHVYYYQDEVDYEKMQNGVLSGFVEALEDPYSEYYTKEDFQKVTEDNRGIYYGIGAYVSVDTTLSRPKISGVIKNTPAEEAGLRENDVIVNVGEVSTYEMTAEEVVSYIRGEEGTTVELTIFREGEPEYLEFSVVRRKVESPTVESEMKGEVGYIQITGFEEVTVHQFEEAYEGLKAQGMKGLVIDVRSNPGGLLTSVLEIGRMILPEGLIVYMEDKNGKRDEYTCDGENQIDIPLAVLVNGNSASASEILAGAVQDYGVGTIVGKTTYGKGVVQNIFGLTDGSAIKLTISNYFTPNGNNIHGVGIVPDVEVELDVDKYYDEGIDTQIEKALEIVREQIK